MEDCSAQRDRVFCSGIIARAVVNYGVIPRSQSCSGIVIDIGIIVVVTVTEEKVNGYARTVTSVSYHTMRYTYAVLRGLV